MRMLALATILACLATAALGAAPQSGRKISGRVAPAQEGTQGAPVPGFSQALAARGDSVRLSAAGGSAQADRVAPIAADGSFEFRDVAPGTYRLVVLPTISIPPLDVLVAERDVTDVLLGLPRLSVGGVVMLDGAGVQPRFRVSFIDTKEPHSETIVDAGSRFQAELPAGEYRVSISQLPPGYALAGMTAGATNLESGTVRVSVSDTAAITIRLAARSVGAPVRGRVEGDARKVTSITLGGPSIAETLTAAIRADGSFEFPPVPPGRYEARTLPSPVSSSKRVEVGAEPLVFTIAAPNSRDFAGEFVRVQPGEFMMGCSPGEPSCSPDEMATHRVGITRPFEIGKYEITQAQWEAVMGTNPSQFKGADRPVENINLWYGAEGFIARLNALDDGYRYRLPTEAEWEYAARAGSAGVFPGNPEDLAWSSQNSGRQTHPVGQKQPNAWGLYDMMGNVWEWVSDWYDPAYYGTSPTIDPMGPPSGLSHVARGGSAAQSPLELRSAHRGGINNYMNNTTTMLYGFRIVREPAQ